MQHRIDELIATGTVTGSHLCEVYSEAPTPNYIPRHFVVLPCWYEDGARRACPPILLRTYGRDVFDGELDQGTPVATSILRWWSRAARPSTDVWYGGEWHRVSDLELAPHVLADRNITFQGI